jgi:biotin operon repressor
MQTLQPLNELYTRYAAGLLDKKEFEGLIFRAIQKTPHHYKLSRWDRDERGDYLSWLYPRISRAIDAYRNTGASFDTYIVSLVRLSAKEYRARQTDKHVAEYAAWTARFPDQYVYQDEPEYLEEQPLPAAVIKQVKNPRQLLILILKCYCYVSDDFLERLAPKVGLERNTLKQMIDQMREQRLKRDGYLRVMRERIYCQFYRCLVYEKRLAAMPENSAVFLRMKAQLERARRRLDTMRKRLAKIRPDATNAQIAQILGVSKGAVDANLHALKTRWKKDSGNPILN